MHCSTLGFRTSLSITNSQSLLKFISIESVTSSNQLSLCCLLLLLPSTFPSIRVFSKESVLCIRWPKLLELQLQYPSFQWIFRTDFLYNWLDWSSWVQETLKSLLQHYNSKESIFWCSAFFRVQLSHSSMTAGKTITLTRWTFVGKVMSLLFNMLSGFVIAFLPRSKHLLISWLQSQSAVILEPKGLWCLKK